MSKRKNDDITPDDDDDTERNSHDKPRQQPAQKVYDFHKKTMEVYPERLRELNKQFLSSVSSQVTTEPYSVLVGNCLDYVRQYFIYEDDLLQYSPWLATRLKQSRSDIVKCLKETIDVYEALARHDFDQLFENNPTPKASAEQAISKTSAQVPSSTVQFRPLPPTTTTTPSSVLSFNSSTATTLSSNTAPSFGFAKSTAPATTTNDSSPSFGLAKSTATNTLTSDSTPSFSFAKSTAPTTLPSDSAPSFGLGKSTAPVTATSDSTPSFSFAKSTAPTTLPSDSGPSFSFEKSTASATATNDSTPSFSFSRPATTTTSDSTPSAGFNLKTAASPETAVNTSPFSFSMPNKGFGTSSFASPSIPAPTSTEKSSISSASSISFAPPPLFSFPTTPATGGAQQGTTEENEDEPSEPPEPEKVEHESDAKLTYRCRMGVNKGGKLIKRGPVQVVLKEANGKHQLIVRSDDTLGRLYLNIIWSKLIEMKKNSTKDFTFICKLNPAMPEIAEGEFVMILFRFDNETDRNDAYDKLLQERA